MGRFGFTFPKIKFEVKYNFQDPTKYLAQEVFGNGEQASRSRIGFVGSASMMRFVAESIVENSGPHAEYGVLQEDIVPSSAKSTVFADKAALAKECGLILTFGSTSAECEELYRDLVAVETPTKFIDFSRATPEVLADTAKACEAKGHSYLECSLGGQQFPADDERLLLFVGGRMDFFETMRPFLSFVCPRVKRVGPAGKAAIARGIADALHAAYTVAAAEALAASKAAGLNVQGMAKSLRLVVDTELTQIAEEASKSKAFATKPFEPTLQDKTDRVDITLDALRNTQAKLPILEAALDRLEAVAAEHGKKNIGAVFIDLDQSIPEPEPEPEPEPLPEPAQANNTTSTNQDDNDDNQGNDDGNAASKAQDNDAETNDKDANKSHDDASSTASGSKASDS